MEIVACIDFFSCFWSNKFSVVISIGKANCFVSRPLSITDFGHFFENTLFSVRFALAECFFNITFVAYHLVIECTPYGSTKAIFCGSINIDIDRLKTVIF